MQKKAELIYKESWYTIQCGLGWFGFCFEVVFVHFFPHLEIMKEEGEKENILLNKLPSVIGCKLKELQLRM